MRRPLRLLQSLAAFVILAAASLTTAAQSQLPQDLREKIDKLSTETFAKTGVSGRIKDAVEYQRYSCAGG